MAEGAGCTGDGGVQLGTVRHAVGDADVADTLAGHGQRLGVRIADDSIAVDAGDIRDFGIVIDQLAIGLVGNDIDRVAVFRALALEQGSEGRECLAAVDHTGGIVRRIDQNGLRVRRERALHSGDIDLEILRIGRDLDEFAAVVGHKDLIFREIRGDCDEFGIVHSQRAEDGDKGWGRAAGEEDVLRADRIAAALRQIVGNSLLGLLRAACGRVAMQSKAVTL